MSEKGKSELENTLSMAFKNQYIIVLIHILLWALFGFVLLVYTPLTWGIELPSEFWIKHVYQYSVLIILFYVNAHVLTPKILLNNKTGLFTLVITSLIIAVMILTDYINVYLDLPELMKKVLGSNRKNKDELDVFMLFSLFVTLGISTTTTVVQHWQKGKEIRQHLQQQQISSELSFLKAQIHPHFFFNTLNNIYSLTYIDIETSREALHKLSWMMRYLLYETQNDITTLKNELRFISGYIELMKLRLNKHTVVEFNHPQDLSNETIAPMLLMSFIENAFKHGVSASKGGKIEISLEANHNQLRLEVKNPIFEIDSNAINDKGIGLVNTQRRLNLLYKDRHELNYGVKNGNQYIVQLQINLL